MIPNWAVLGLALFLVSSNTVLSLLLKIFQLSPGLNNLSAISRQFSTIINETTHIFQPFCIPSLKVSQRITERGVLKCLSSFGACIMFLTNFRPIYLVFQLAPPPSSRNALQFMPKSPLHILNVRYSFKMTIQNSSLIISFFNNCEVTRKT